MSRVYRGQHAEARKELVQREGAVDTRVEDAVREALEDWPPPPRCCERVSHENTHDTDPRAEVRAAKEGAGPMEQ
jgi:hypothetical protein